MRCLAFLRCLDLLEMLVLLELLDLLKILTLFCAVGVIHVRTLHLSALERQPSSITWIFLTLLGHVHGLILHSRM